MRQVTITRDFEAWRVAARGLIASGARPDELFWTTESESVNTPLLPGLVEKRPDFPTAPTAVAAARFPVPPRFVELAKLVACHRDPDRWAMLYRVLWRVARGERNLLDDAVDDDVRPLLSMERAVRFDRHKMTAFVRFRELSSDSGPHYVAWYRPDHFIVRTTAPFFAGRFAPMRWSILTPDDCAHWPGSGAGVRGAGTAPPSRPALSFTAGLPANEAPPPDAHEDLWRAYYSSIFNPARVNPRAMKKEMPVRFWDVLPEAQLIPDLLRDAPRRVSLMVANTPRDYAGAGAFLPGDRRLEALRAAAPACRGCPLHGPATGVVFGEGPADAKAMFVGEQPGDQEDLAGKPFVGPAGQLLDDALIRTGIDRSALYVTNAVKHFKFEPRGTRRIHAKPNAREVAACAPWLDAEIAAVRPGFILCLGVTAAQVLLGREFRMTTGRGAVHRATRHAPWVMATLHPSALLRIPDPARRDEATAQLLADLRTFREALDAA